jgi:enterochelin esterase-like enzyme
MIRRRKWMPYTFERHMAIKRAKWPAGRTVTLEHTSKALADNALGDPSTRLLDIWLPPQYDQSRGRGRGRRFPVLFDLVGYAGSGRSHTSWRAFGDNVPEQAARLVHQNKLPPCVIVFPDCFTALGGNQYINSSAIGRYADYLTLELVPFVDREFRTQASREHRGCFGKSSGGYGAMIHGMRYARCWGAIAAHSGDAYFDFVYRADWPNTLNELAKHRRRKRRAGAIHVPAEELGAGEGLDDGRVRRFLQAVWNKPSPSTADVHCLMNLAMAASYDPDPGAPNGFRLPFNLETGELIETRWRNWLKHDPIRLVDRYRGNLKSLRGIFIDCGWRDQYHIHYGSRILSKRLEQAGVAHRYEEFDDTHSGIDYRMDRSLPFLARALS